MQGHELAMALRKAYLAMHRKTDARLASFGVTADQFVVLAALSQSDAVTQRDLVERTSSDPNTLRAMLVLLERRRLIERKAHPSDGRARSVSLTPKGKQVFQKLWKASEVVRKRLFTAFPPQEVKVLLEQLQHIVTAVTAEPANRSTPRVVESRNHTPRKEKSK